MADNWTALYTTAQPTFDSERTHDSPLNLNCEYKMYKITFNSLSALLLASHSPLGENFTLDTALV